MMNTLQKVFHNTTANSLFVRETPGSSGSVTAEVRNTTEDLPDQFCQSRSMGPTKLSLRPQPRKAEASAPCGTAKDISILQNLLAEQKSLQGELEAMKAQMHDDRRELEESRRAFRAERAIFAEQVDTRKAFETQLFAEALTPLGKEVCIDVGGELFALPLKNIMEHGGYLKNIFSGEFQVPTEEDGAYVLSFPYITRDDFRLVAQFYVGDLPSYIAPEVAARAVLAADRLDIPKMAVAVCERTIDIAQQSKQVIEELRRGVDVLLNTARPSRWEYLEIVPHNYRHQDNICRLPESWEPFAVHYSGVVCCRRPYIAP